MRKKLDEEDVHPNAIDFVCEICAIMQMLWKEAAKRVRLFSKLSDAKHQNIREMFDYMKRSLNGCEMSINVTLERIDFVRKNLRVNTGKTASILDKFRKLQPSYDDSKLGAADIMYDCPSSITDFKINVLSTPYFRMYFLQLFNDFEYRINTKCIPFMRKFFRTFSCII